MKENIINQITCPDCGYKMDRATPTPGRYHHPFDIAAEVRKYQGGRDGR